MRPPDLLWVGLAVLVLAEIAYPLVAGRDPGRAGDGTVLLGFAVVGRPRAGDPGLAGRRRPWCGHHRRWASRSRRWGSRPAFRSAAYAYGDALGPKLLGVPLLIPLAWTWMAWPAWLVAGRTGGRAAGCGFRWPGWGWPGGTCSSTRRWSPRATGAGRDPRSGAARRTRRPALNYAGWLVVAPVLMALMSLLLRRWSILSHPAHRWDDIDHRLADAPMLALYLWTYSSSVLAHAVFLGLPASACGAGWVWGCRGATGRRGSFRDSAW